MQPPMSDSSLPLSSLPPPSIPAVPAAPAAPAVPPLLPHAVPPLPSSVAVSHHLVAAASRSPQSSRSTPRVVSNDFNRRR